MEIHSTSVKVSGSSRAHLSFVVVVYMYYTRVYILYSTTHVLFVTSSGASFILCEKQTFLLYYIVFCYFLVLSIFIMIYIIIICQVLAI